MKKIILAIVIATGHINAWETTTHRAIDKSAIENSGNLLSFINDSDIENVNYENKQFESYGLTYFEYFNDELSSDAMAEWGQTFDSNIPSYQNLIEAGTMLEDAQWQNNAMLGVNGRFLNHFYNPQDGGDGLWWNNNAVDWAKGLGDGSRFNYYSYSQATHYFKEGFSQSDAKERRKYQAKMFVSVGHIMHLVNDMNVPSHTRADAHPLGDPHF